MEVLSTHEPEILHTAKRPAAYNRSHAAIESKKTMSAGLEPTTFGVFQREPKTNALPLRQDTLSDGDKKMLSNYNNIVDNDALMLPYPDLTSSYPSIPV
jgi:hypothetical protein